MATLGGKRPPLTRTSASDIKHPSIDGRLLVQREGMKKNREALKYEEKRLVIFKGTALLCKANMVVTRDRISRCIDLKHKELAEVKLQLTELSRQRYSNSSDAISANHRRQTLLAKEKILVDKFDLLLTEFGSTNSNVEELASIVEETNQSLRYIQRLKRQTRDFI